MSDTPHVDHTHETVVVANDYSPRISWRAVLAGVVVVLSLSWLFHLLGLAVGLSVADSYDSVTIEGGLDDAAAIWIVVSWLVTFFIGALVTARLAGILDDFSGMLHGLVLWGVATIAMVYLSYVGVSSLLQTGKSVIAATAQGVSATAQTVGSTAADMGSVARQAVDTQFAESIQNRLADSAIEVAANTDSELSEQDLRSAINDLNQRTLRRIVSDLTNNDQEGAAEIIAEATSLSQNDAEAIVEAAYEQLEEAIGNPDNDEPLTEDLQNQLANQVDSYIAEMDARGGPETTPRDVRQAIDRLDAEAVRQLGMKLVNGDARGAKRVLAQNTNLSRGQIDDVYEGASNALQQEVEEYETALNQTMEEVTDYSQAIVWVIFGGSAIALVVSLAGGWLGATSTREAYVETA